MKILLVLNALDFKKAQLHFPAYIARLSNADVTAIFLENSFDVNEPLSKYSSLEGFYNPYVMESTDKRKIIHENIHAYKLACTELGLSGKLIRAKGVPEDETIEASRFADLLLVTKDLSFAYTNEDAPTNFSEIILSQSKCAILVMPLKAQEINKLCFACNGSHSSMYAIRQFTYLFPFLKDLPVTVLYVSEKDEEIAAHKKSIKEYLQLHYKNIEFKILYGNPSSAILSYLEKQKNCLVTFGAYGRSRFSQFFRKSRAENILGSLDMPVFITHP
jgi:hypothetical protein